MTVNGESVLPSSDAHFHYVQLFRYNSYNDAGAKNEDKKGPCYTIPSLLSDAMENAMLHNNMGVQSRPSHQITDLPVIQAIERYLGKCQKPRTIFEIGY